MLPPGLEITQNSHQLNITLQLLGFVFIFKLTLTFFVFLVGDDILMDTKSKTHTSSGSERQQQPPEWCGALKYVHQLLADVV